MAEGSEDPGTQTKCEMAIEHVSPQIEEEYPQYPDFARQFKLHCIEEAFEEIDVILDDVAEGFDESVILEAIADDIEIKEEDKEKLCYSIHNLFSNYIPPRPAPCSLNLIHLDTAFSENEMESMRKLVSAEAKLLEPNNADKSIYAVLVIGEKNHLPLLSYLVDTYNRCRLALYFNEAYNYAHKQEEFHGNQKKCQQFESKNAVNSLALEEFCAACPTMQELQVHDKETLLCYKNAMKPCIHRNGLFYCLPLVHKNTPKIVDSLLIFWFYSASVLIAVNRLIVAKSIRFPTQIDVWIIPKDIKQQIFDDDDDDDDDENSNDMYQGLAYCDNVQRLAIVPDLNDMDNLVDVLGNVIDAVLNKQSHKRMVLIIDRRGNVDHDMLYAYLPLNTQNTPELYVSMVNQTKTELIPSYAVAHDDDEEEEELKVENTMDGNSGFMNMFIMSLHLHAKREVAMYWHYCGSCNRFCVMDMVTLWPSHFIMDKEEPSQDTQRIQAQIENEANYDELVDINFETFYAINTGSEWRDTQAPLYRAKPRILQRRSSDEERRENVDKWFKLHEREEEYRTRRQMMKSMRKLPTQKRIIPRWAKLQRHNTVNEGDVKQEEDAICSGFAIGKDEEMEFVYTTDFDENGLLYFLGSYARRQAYKNPVQRELVSVVLSSLAADSKNEMYFVGRECVRCMTNNTQPSYMALNLQSIAMKVSHYTLKHHTSHNVALTSWTLEGSRDGSKWIVLKNHVGDTSLQHPGDTKTWRIDSSANDYLSQFRIYMTSVNNSGRWYLGCSGIELYGHAYGGLVSESLSPDFDEKQNALQQQNLATPFNVESRSKSQNHLAALNDDENKKKMKSAKSWSNLTIKKFVSRRSLDPSTPRALKIKWNVYPKGYKKWVQKGGKVILRNGGDQEQIMFASSNSLNEGCCEFKIKYESIENEYCHDAVGIISNTQACRVPMQWITDDTTIGYISDNVDLKWKSGQVLSVQIHLILKKSYMNFCIDGQKMTNDIPITYGTYYPLLCTQTDDAKFTLMTQ